MLKQAYRDAAVSSPLGEDVLVFRRMVAVERISAPFSIRVEMVAQQPVDFNAMLGQDLTVRLRLESGERFFNGCVQSFAHTGGAGRYATYEAVLRPRLWFLSRNRNCRIFEGRTVPDIVKEVLQDGGIGDIENRLSGRYQPWEYCVQYQESEFAFISRLLEHEGIYYHFTHRNGAHTLVLGDGIGAHVPLTPTDRLRYNPEARHREHVPSVDEWSITREVTAGAYAVDDFGFERPGAKLFSRFERPQPYALSNMEVFEYPGNMAYLKPGQRGAAGEAYARQRLEEALCGHERIEGVTTVRELACGQLFTLTDHPLAEQNREYIVLSTETEIRSDELAAGERGGGEPYRCRFSVIGSREQYRPPRTTPVPVMRGPQTAIVTGKPGKPIWTDEHGRVKVRFHWDRTGKADDTTSCWIRVAQGWAGKGWGAQFVPRVGQEVIVDFLDGDPNRPVVTGSLYNGDAKPPFNPGSTPTRSGLRSDTVDGKGANELRFEDKAGHEQVFLHAQRNLDSRVRHDSLEWVGNDRHLHVFGHQLEKVGGDKHLTVLGDHSERIAGTVSLTAGEDVQHKVGRNAALQSGMEVHLKAGTNLVLEAGATVTIKASGSFITIGPSGVTISGPMVMINSGGAAGSGSGAHPETPKGPKAAEQGEHGGPTAVDPKPKYTPPSLAHSSHPIARQLKDAHKHGKPFCAQCEAARKAAAAARGHGGGHS